MTGKKRILSALLTLVLFVGVLLPAPAAAADLYFTSVDDSLLPLTSSTMPVWSGGRLYVPYTVFDRPTAGVDLGIRCIYSRSTNTLTLYTPQQMLVLVFDLNTGNSRDELTGNVYQSKAIVRNGQPFVPVNFVCDFFELTRTYTRMDEGYLIRIKSSAAVLSDSRFIDAAADLIDRRIREYNQSIASSPETSTPVPPPVPDDDPAADVRTYLAFLCHQSDTLGAALDALDAANVRAVFFCPSQLLQKEQDLVRRILGTGHSVGLLAEGEDLAATRDILAEGSAVLARTALSRTTLAYTPAEQRDTLEAEGWVCWEESLLLTPSEQTRVNSFAANTLLQLDGRVQTTCLTMEADESALRVLPTLLRQLKLNHFVFSTPMETRL